MTDRGAPVHPDDLLEVRLIGVPVETQARASEHNEELQREFALIHHSGSASDSTPGRLLDLVEQVRERFGGFAAGPQAELDAARARGLERVDLTYRLPPAVAPAAIALGEMLDEADAFCRSGDLLTLATPEELVAFRRWFLDEFVRQSAGQPPRSWDDYRTAGAAMRGDVR